MENTFKPTDAELEILQILWEFGPATVRFINDKLNEKKEVGYTTTLKIMQIMTDKQLLVREKSGKSHIYSSTVKEKDSQRLLLNRFLENAFSGSASKLVMQALGNHRTSKEELNQIRELLDKIEKGNK